MTFSSCDVSSDARLEQLVLASAALTSEASLDAVLHRVVKVAAEVIGARYAAIGVFTPDEQGFERFVTHGITGSMQPLLSVPVNSPRGSLGNLYLAEKSGNDGQLTVADERAAVLLASITAAAIENARLHEESAHLLAEVHQLHRTRERFFAMVNHEMRNALAAVYGWAELLVRKRDPATVHPAALQVLEAAEGAVELISDLLDLSRLDEDRLKPVIRTVSARDLVRRAVSRAKPGTQARDLRIVMALAPGLPAIETDARRVEQILMNLLTNAIKYTSPSSRIRVSAERNDDHVLFRVEDEGPGIRAADADRIFDVYVTSADSAKQGVGLGLPLSRRLAQLLGGELWAVPHDGAGIFVLALPVRRAS